MITREHVRQLLDRREERPTLVVLRGHAQVIPAAEVGTRTYAGAMEVATAEDLGPLSDGDGEVSDHELDEQAARLEAMVTRLGA